METMIRKRFELGTPVNAVYKETFSDYILEANEKEKGKCKVRDLKV